MLEIPIEDKGKYPLCYGMANEHGNVDMCDSCKFQHDCAQITMKCAPPRYALSFKFAAYVKCSFCGKMRFCGVLEYGDVTINLCRPDIMQFEHKVTEWKIEEDDKNIWKPHKEWLDTA